MQSSDRISSGGIEYIDHPDLGLIVRIDDPNGESSYEELQSDNQSDLPQVGSSVEAPHYQPRGWVHIRIDDGEEWSCMDGAPCPTS